MAERSFNYDTAVGRVFRAAFLSLLPFLITKPGNSHLSPIAQPSVNHSIPSPPSDISLTIFFLSRHRLGEEEKIERQLLIRKRQPPDNWSPSPSHRLKTRSLLSLFLFLSKILHLIAPCNNYPRGYRRCVNHERELSHRGGWEREREIYVELKRWKGDGKITVWEVDYGTVFFKVSTARGCLLVDGYDRVECCWKIENRGRGE